MNYVITLVYNNAAMMRASLERFDQTFGLEHDKFKHIFVDQHFPKGRQEILDLMRERAQIGNFLMIDPGRNVGLASGFNLALSAIKLHADDTVYAYDPDMFPLTKGWGTAMADVFAADPKIGWISMWTPHTLRETTERGYVDQITGGHEVRNTKAACLNSVSAFSGNFLLKSNGAHEPNPLYGGFEISMYAKLKENGFDWVFLKGFVEEVCPDDNLVDKDYRTWKWETTHGGQKQIQFSDWLNLPRS